MRTSLHAFILLALFSSLTNAGLYPTQPIAATKYRGGTWNTISWIDSPKSTCSTPMEDLGLMRIDLWVGGKISVSQTAGIDFEFIDLITPFFCHATEPSGV